MLEKKHKRVLVVSNNSFSKTNSNGRTLGNLFYGWPKDKLAQFCISTDGVDCETCTNYYIVTDSEVLHSSLKFKSAKSLVREDLFDRKIIKDRGGQSKRRQKNALTSLIRHYLWKLGTWKTAVFKDWVKKFNPDIVVWQSGDTTFLMDIAYKIAKEYKIPLILYNTEEYYFKERNFMHQHFLDFVCWPYYRNTYRRHFRNTMKYASCSIYLNTSLQRLYMTEFQQPSYVIYNSSSITHSDHEFNVKNPTFSYLGNLGVNRHIPLMEIGKTLCEINPHWHLDIYGAASGTVRELLDKADGIVYHGKVSYEDVKSIIYHTDILFHAEAQVGQYKDDLRYAFSSKIADSLTSGISFVVYASPDLAISEYIEENKSGWVASDIASLRETINEIIHNTETRNIILKNAYTIAKKNHLLTANAERFRNIICNAANKIQPDEDFSNNTNI